MSKKIHQAVGCKASEAKNIVTILEGKDGFKKITGTGDFKKRANAAMKDTKIYHPETESSGFGSRPSFTLDASYGTIKSDPDAYSKILAGSSRKSSRKANQYAKNFSTQKRRAKRPKVDAETVAKYAPKKPQHKPAERAMPSVSLVYAQSPSHWLLRPQYSVAFKGMTEAAQALKKGDIFAKSLIHFLAPNRESVFTQAYRLSLFFHS